jgi:hypothetical protein
MQQTQPRVTHHPAGIAGAHRTPARIHRVRAGQVSRGVTAPVPRVYLSVSLTGPGPSGSPEPTRLCRGCSRLPRRSPDRLPPASPHRHDGRAPKVSHLHPTQQRLVAHAVVPDLPAHARAAPADGSHVQHQGHRAPRAGEGLVVRGPLRRVGADTASPSTPSRAITPSELRPTRIARSTHSRRRRRRWNGYGGDGGDEQRLRQTEAIRSSRSVSTRRQGRLFSMAMSPATIAIPMTLMTPNANSDPTRAQQQPTHQAPFLSRVCRPPNTPSHHEPSPCDHSPSVPSAPTSRQIRPLQRRAQDA